MPRPRTILALGTFHPDRRKRIETVARDTGFEIVLRDTPEAASKWLDSGTPRVVLFDTAIAKAHSVCLKVRSKKTLSAVPIIGLARVIGDSALSKLFAAGADDVVPINSQEALRRRLQAIPADESLQPPPDRGVAVVADSDHDRCSVIGRTMMNAGYEVRFAVERRMLEHYASSPDVRLVVASAELGSPVEMVDASRLGGCQAPWIITDIERDVAAGAEIIPEARGAVVVSAYIPPDCLLFVSNDLIGNTGASKRAHVRALHGTMVSFREAGSDEDDLGFTYNVSLEGLFVRTLAPPTDARVWIELRPPGQSRRVRLAGEVKWRRPFDPGKFAITPPGFGVYIRDGLGEDLELWSQSVDKLVGNARRRRSVNQLLEETLRDSWIEPVPAEAVAPPSLPPLTDLDPLAANAAVLPPKHPHAPRPVEPRKASSQRLTAQSPKPASVHNGPAPAAPKLQGRTLLGIAPAGLPISPKGTSEPKSPESQGRPKLASEPKGFDPKASQPKQAAFDPKASAPKLDAQEPKVAAPLDQQPMISMEDLFPPETPAAASPAPQPAAPAPQPAAAAAELATPAHSETAAAVVAAPAPKPHAKNRTVVLAAVLGAVVVIGGAAAALVLSSGSKTPSAAEPRPVVTQTPAPSATQAPAPSATQSAPPTEMPPAVSAAASASAAPQPGASAAASSAPPEVPDEGPDGSDLLSMEGYLIVKSSAALDVYATGLRVGTTNQRNKSRCGMKFVRLGEGDPPKWKSAGATVNVACRGVTRITIDPK